jgi:hypothetical protein
MEWSHVKIQDLKLDDTKVQAKLDTWKKPIKRHREGLVKIHNKLLDYSRIQAKVDTGRQAQKHTESLPRPSARDNETKV